MNLFFGYPKCSTCQKAKKFLEEHQISYQEQDIKKSPPTEKEIAHWIEKYKIDLKKLWNTSGILYREKNLKELLPTMSEEEKIKLLAENGMLIKRPIFIKDDQIRIGFKKEEWENL